MVSPFEIVFGLAPKLCYRKHLHAATHIKEYPDSRSAPDLRFRERGRGCGLDILTDFAESATAVHSIFVPDAETLVCPQFCRRRMQTVDAEPLICPQSSIGRPTMAPSHVLAP